MRKRTHSCALGGLTVRFGAPNTSLSGDVKPIRVPYYWGDLKWEPHSENYPYVHLRTLSLGARAYGLWGSAHHQGVWGLVFRASDWDCNLTMGWGGFRGSSMRCPEVESLGSGSLALHVWWLWPWGSAGVEPELPLNPRP